MKTYRISISSIVHEVHTIQGEDEQQAIDKLVKLSNYDFDIEDIEED